MISEYLTNIRLNNFVCKGNNVEAFNKHEINNVGSFDKYAINNFGDFLKYKVMQK